MGGGVRRRHHVVPAGYQRGFADGERIRLVAKDGTVDRVVGVKDVFVEEGFLAGQFVDLPVDVIERAFADIEAVVVPDVRSITSLALSPDQAAAVKCLVAMLWARSYATRATSDRVRQTTAAERGPQLKTSPKVRAAFKTDFGRDPDPGEIEAHVDRRVREFVSANKFYVDQVVRFYNQAVKHFTPLTVSLYSADKLPYGLITSDNPVLLSTDMHLLGVARPTVSVALLDARVIYTPLHRRMGACLTRSDESCRLASVGVVRINNAMWRNARAHVVAHPDEDWPTATGIARASAVAR